MVKINFENLPSTNTPLSAENLNTMQDNIESGITDAVNIGISGDLVVNSIRTKNIFDGIMEQGTFDPQTGTLATTTNRIRSVNYANVESGTYTISIANANHYVVVYVYNTDGTYIQSESNASWQPLPFTKTFSGNRKIKIAIRKADDSTIVPSDIQDIMIEKNENKTTYTSYQNLKGEENYTTEEIRIGNWINGKPLYRKVINVGNKPTDATINVSDAVSNVDTLVRISGTAYNATFNQYYNIPNTHDTMASWYINALLVNKKDLQVRGGIGWNNAGGLTNIYVVLEYTKTTD